MASFWGMGNGLGEYILVLLVYTAMVVLMRYAHPRVELNFRRTYWILCIAWGLGVFIGNYLFYLIRILSFLPWLNNALHAFVWIGLCLSFLYAGRYKKPIWEQCLLFIIFSFLVKVGEHWILGTWDLPYFFFIKGNLAYLIGWSVLDGLYPYVSMVGLKWVSRFVQGVIVPQAIW